MTKSDGVVDLRLVFLIVGGLLIAGCADDDPGLPRDAGMDADDGLEAITIMPATLNRDLDLLFVIDNSGSMAEEQVALTQRFGRLTSSLNRVAGGLPDLHLGVISTNVGTGGVNIGGCSSATRPRGDDGNLLTNQCAALSGSFISDLKNPDGSRVVNYTGDLESLFTCMARLGTTGCGFEQPLEAMFRALQPEKNPGFLRPSARLAVVILSDEDDCSAKPGGALFGDPAATVTSPLGPRTSFRCFEFGVACDGDTNPRAFGPRTGCVPREDSPYVESVAHYVDQLRSLKPNPRDVIVTGIIGQVDDARSAVVGPDVDDATRPAVGASCSSSGGLAFPGHRLRTFFEGFPEHHRVATICNNDLEVAVTSIADEIFDSIGDPCIDRAVIDTDPSLYGLQPRCNVRQFREVNGARVDDVSVPACDGSATPCWQVFSDSWQCPRAPDNNAIEIDRGGASAPPDSLVEVRCAVET